MQVKEIDHVGPQPLQALLAGLQRIFGAAVDAALAVGQAQIAELGGQDRTLAPVAKGAADQFLVRALPIHVGGVDEIGAQFDGAVDGGDGPVVVRRAIDRRHGHAAQPHGRNLQAAFPEFTLLHLSSPPV